MFCRIFTVLLMVSLTANPVYAQTKYKDSIVTPPGLSPKSSNEYFSSIPNKPLLIPVYIWGEVKQPGLYFVPVESTLTQVLSSAGGPTSEAALPEIRLISAQGVREIDIFEQGHSELIKPNDTIFIDKSIKRDLPLLFGAITTTLAILSLAISQSN